jgi:signal transduction histidine kinase
MSAAAVVGWALAVAAGVAAVWAWARLRARMELVARAAHELRSPLCAARLAVHAAAREGGWPALAPVDRELARAGLALDDLGAARAGAHAGDQAERLDAVDLLQDVRETWAPLAWPVRREVRADATTATLRVRGDRLRLSQALGNLVGNALEHGSGSVILRARPDGDRIRFEVEDRGAGLPAPLAALTRRPRAGRGARGRGLAIAQEIAQRHGGTLHEERTTGGCRMVLTLPDAAAARTHRPAPDADLLAALRWGGVARPAPRRRAERSAS